MNASGIDTNRPVQQAFLPEQPEFDPKIPFAWVSGPAIAVIVALVILFRSNGYVVLFKLVMAISYHFPWGDFPYRPSDPGSLRFIKISSMKRYSHENT